MYLFKRTARKAGVGRATRLSSLGFVIISIGASIACSAFAQGTTSFEEMIEALSSRPGTTIRRSRDGEVDIVEYQTRGGVTLTVRQEKGKSTSVMALDRSNHGAVLCGYQIYASMRDHLKACKPGRHSDLVEDFDDAIAKMNSFIVDNALTPIKEEALIDQEAQRFKAAYGSEGSTLRQRACESGVLTEMIDAYAKSTRAERQKSVSELLSVPRLPVMNPCL